MGVYMRKRGIVRQMIVACSTASHGGGPADPIHGGYWPRQGGEPWAGPAGGRGRACQCVRPRAVPWALRGPAAAGGPAVGAGRGSPDRVLMRQRPGPWPRRRGMAAPPAWVPGARGGRRCGRAVAALGARPWAARARRERGPATRAMRGRDRWDTPMRRPRRQ